MNHIWGFEQADDEDLATFAAEQAPQVAEDPTLVRGRDSDQLVTVVASEDGTIHAVELSGDWRKSFDPPVLHQHALAAFNEACVLAAAKQAEQLNLGDGSAVEAATSPPEETDSDRPDGPPITLDHAMQLLRTVTADVERALGDAGSPAQPLTVESGGRHVTASGAYGHMTDLQLGTSWYGSRTSGCDLRRNDLGGKSDSGSRLVIMCLCEQQNRRRLPLPG